MSSPGERVRGGAVTVRRMRETDAPAAFRILEESPEASPWSQESLEEAAKDGAGWAAEIDGAVAGILIGRGAGDEFEILNLAVATPFRRRGIATQLVSAALERASGAGALQSFLEVRASNAAAFNLYTRLGFRVLGRRPNYYRHPVEDAILLVFHNEPTRK